MAFIVFNNRVLNTNFITQMWKSEEHNINHEKCHLIRIQLHQTQGSFRESFANEEDRDNAFHRLVCQFNEK